ncbi:MAG: restriction endonuclease [Spirochaetes bacterium]|nr:restriction endonuclease [Spirochaetota bacterium]
MLVFIILIQIIVGLVIIYMFYVNPSMNPFNRAMKFLEIGNIDEAILEFTRSIEKDPRNHIAHFKLAHLYLQKDVLLKAEEHFKKVLEIGKFSEEIKRLDILKEIARICFDLKKYEEAFLALKEILTIFPSDYMGNFYMGLIHAGQLVYEEASQYFKKAISSRPNDIESRVNSALCLIQMQDLNSAIRVLEEANQKAPDNEKVKFYMGVCLYMAKIYKRSIDFLLPVLKATSDTKIKYFCYRLIASSFFFLNEYERAREYLDSGMEFVKLNSLMEEYKTLLFDYGMLNAVTEDYHQAHEKWKILELIDHTYRHLEDLFAYIELKTRPVKEEEEEQIDQYLTPAAASYFRTSQRVIGMEEETKEISEDERVEEAFEDIKKEWFNSFIPENFLWKMGGLTSTKRFNIEMLTGKEKLDNVQKRTGIFDGPGLIKEFMNLDRRQFEDVGRRIVQKLGYTIVKLNFKPTIADFVEGDGIDFVTKEPGSGQMVLIQLRRWDQGKAGEIPLRNMTQNMAEEKARKGIFIVPAELTEGAEKFLQKMKNITVFTERDMPRLLRGTMDFSQTSPGSSVTGSQQK